MEYRAIIEVRVVLVEGGTIREQYACSRVKAREREV